MKRPLAIFLALALVLLAPPLAKAQGAGKIPRVGFLGRTEPPAANLAGFRKGMADRGHVEGKTYVIVPQWGRPRGKRTKASILAQKLVKRGVDVIVTVGSTITRAANRAAPSIPIVMASSADPVRAGLVKSLAKPGGNITGMSSAAVDFSVKGVEILTQLVPGLRRIGAIHRGRSGRTGVRGKLWAAANKNISKALSIEVVTFHTNKKDDFDALFRRVSAAGFGAITLRSTPSYSTAQRRGLVLAARRVGLPSMSTTRQMAKLGALVSFGPSRPWMFSRAAAYVDLILRGAKPADLPVERPSKFHLAINLKTARVLGLTLPPAILLRADEVIQ
jgi:putative ABC transport system substrate-binding protein